MYKTVWIIHEEKLKNHPMDKVNKTESWSRWSKYKPARLTISKS